MARALVLHEGYRLAASVHHSGQSAAYAGDASTQLPPLPTRCSCTCSCEQDATAHVLRLLQCHAPGSDHMALYHVEQHHPGHACMQATRNGSDLWLSYWVAHIEEDFTAARHAQSPGLAGVPDMPLSPGFVLPLQSSAVAPSVLPSHAFTAPWLEQGHQESQHRKALHLGWLPPETSFYFSVLVLIAAANSAFTMVPQRASSQALQFGVIFVRAAVDVWAGIGLMFTLWLN